MILDLRHCSSAIFNLTRRSKSTSDIVSSTPKKKYFKPCPKMAKKQDMKAANDQQKQHFVLVHGTNHGAWCWYKVKPQLESSGHRVTVIDLAGSGINKKAIQEVHSFHDYSEPLLKIMSSLSPNEKVILVGHSLGGMNLSLAMEMFPEKVLVAVFLTAFMPDTIHLPSYIPDQFVERTPTWMDTQISPYGSSSKPLTSVHFGPKFLSSKLYQLSPIEDVELAKTLIRPGSLFQQDLSKAKKFSDEAYGSVARVYVVCSEDETITEEFQRWMIKNAGAKEVVEIKGADHMPMFSKTQELCNCLLQVANNYSRVIQSN